MNRGGRERSRLFSFDIAFFLRTRCLDGPDSSKVNGRRHVENVIGKDLALFVTLFALCFDRSQLRRKTSYYRAFQQLRRAVRLQSLEESHQRIMPAPFEFDVDGADILQVAVRVGDESRCRS